MRLFTVFVFYFTQGISIGFFLFAMPAWLAANGASTGQIASVVSAAVLPWTLKFFLGFVMDRYTYLPMGRRRIWIVSAQALIVTILLAAAWAAPGPSEYWLISIFAFLANAGTATQDVAIDSLIVDIMPENERTKATGIMSGAQILGMSSTTYAAGQLLASYGTSAAFAAAAFFVGVVLAYGLAMREREGERLVPWSRGAAHPRNSALQVDAWAPLLITSAKAMLAPLSLIALVFLLGRATPNGVAEVYHPLLATGTGGWEQTDYTNTISVAQFASGMFALFIGGWAVGKIGPQRSAAIMCAMVAVFALGFGLSQDNWADPALLTAYFWQIEFFGTMLMVAMIPILMRLCNPRVAATQFTLYMAAANLGRPLGNSIAVTSDTAGRPELMYFALAGIFAVAVVIFWRVRFPTQSPESEGAIEASQPVVQGQPNPRFD